MNAVYSIERAQVSVDDHLTAVTLIPKMSSSQPPSSASAVGEPTPHPTNSAPMGSPMAYGTANPPSGAGHPTSNFAHQVDPQAPYSSTGVQSQPTESSGSHAGTQTKGEGVGQGIKSVLAGIHGTGESLRGNLNAAFDKTFGDEEGAAKNASIAQQGEREISSGQFQRSHRHD